MRHSCIVFGLYQVYLNIVVSHGSGRFIGYFKFFIKMYLHIEVFDFLISDLLRYFVIKGKLSKGLDGLSVNFSNHFKFLPINQLLVTFAGLETRVSAC